LWLDIPERQSRGGERAHLKRLARLPDIYLSEGYQESSPKDRIYMGGKIRRISFIVFKEISCGETEHYGKKSSAEISWYRQGSIGNSS